MFCFSTIIVFIFKTSGYNDECDGLWDRSTRSLVVARSISTSKAKIQHGFFFQFSSHRRLHALGPLHSKKIQKSLILAFSAALLNRTFFADFIALFMVEPGYFIIKTCLGKKVLRQILLKNSPGLHYSLRAVFKKPSRFLKFRLKPVFS